jgi:hypothetical protein
VLKDYLLRGYAINQRLNQLEDKVDRRLSKTERDVIDLKEKVDFFVQTSQPPVRGVFYNGQVFDAHVFAAKFILSAKKSILLIDSWVDVVTLELLAKKAKGVTVEIVTSRRGNKISASDVAKFNAQHGGLTVTVSKNFHDRFIAIDGKRLYEYAYKGRTDEARELAKAAVRRIHVRQITIHEIDMEQGTLCFTAECSKGTYIRTLCHDIGQSLGCGGCMSALRRTEAGAFSVENALRIADVQRLQDEGRLGEYLLPVDSLFSGEKSCTAAENEARRIRCGSDYPTGLGDGLYRVYDRSGAFLMLGRAEAGVMKTVKSFFEVE